MRRVIVVGKNNELPRNAMSRQLLICPACEGMGHEWSYYTINPSEKPHKEPCSACDGEGAIEKESAA
jgi:DnaJ-class molecular chaperone